MQLQSFTDDPIYKDHHPMQVELIHTYAKVGPNAEPRFRDDCKFIPIFFLYFCSNTSWKFRFSSRNGTPKMHELCILPEKLAKYTKCFTTSYPRSQKDNSKQFKYHSSTLQ